ncbi:hypothetical protein [Sphingobium indicum]|uniref:Uncharacterized protein n=1 Tax=Sphingobium indicum (strain DSM 16412 / CCM 7286 / MTCC 6364 / B90A) TaxID=861109 RepID=A0A1L5BMP3_SPHIB|nr:hypothetical protein [Sphingobium indicum]APL94116.1 hypothetical protein SIDU_06120 [Sphingobium indicum B90A]
MSRQYVACKFRPDDKRSYTYHNDGEPVAVGDEVKIAGRSDDGWQRVHVVAIADEMPSFETKPILGKVEPEAPALDLGEAE